MEKPESQDRPLELHLEDSRERISQSYIYSQLARSSIRLLRFISSTSPNAIECELQTFPLSYTPQYHSLSYFWGDPIRENTLSCNGKKIMITTTLKQALERLINLDRGGVKWIWIDQICINQANSEEKGIQVNMMREIYQKSEGTVVWLGPNILGIETTARLLEKMQCLHKEDQDPINGRRKRKFYTLTEFEAKTLPPAGDRSWKILAEILARPWFVRTWVIQEAVLSRVQPRMLCGSYELDWQKLLGSCSWMVSLCYRITPIFQYTDAWHAVRSLHLFNDLMNVGLPWDLETLINRAIRFKATEPRDKIYSLVGLAGEASDSSTIPKVLQADYNKPTRDVFRDVTRHIIESTGSLSMLSLIRYKPNWEKFPSWSVDFTAGVHWERISDLVWGRHQRGWHATREDPNKASDNLPVDLQASFSNDHLNVGGILIDTLGTPVEAMSQANLDCFGNQALIAWKMAQYTRTRYPSIEALGQAFMVTFTANWRLSGTELMEHQPQRHFWNYLWRIYDRLLEEARSEQHYQEVEQCFHHVLKPQSIDDPGDADLYRHYLDAAYNRRMFFTKDKFYLGLGPSIMQEGDLLCVLFGGATPLILRPEGEHYRFVGECYVHDLMSGEAIKDWHDGKYTAQRFCLI
ncbi:uncharacterized protein PAC_19594 [Phialocephala subalpina]|uniref:Heterokaryon incompatibility domain-containing protein n=1 Tax=Phialocephala subalpina TaxID=576137 RepID=A0A1L7XXC0_9HELO|nr:uncharacterized protein PAC_19594 [Phialocephala subalpina]